jgi:aminoglycoside phosphotransferase (APT) family kinase protein
VAVGAERGGWAYWTFEVDGIWAFRFPRYPAVAELAAKELPLLPLLAEKIGCAVPVPGWRVTHNGRPAFGYRKILGCPLDARDIRNNPELAEELVRTLRQLHSFPIEDIWKTTSATVRAVTWPRSTCGLEKLPGSVLAPCSMRVPPRPWMSGLSGL